MKIYETTQKIKWVSKNRPNSLIFRISGALQQITNLKNNTKVKVEVHLENNKKIIKIYED